MIEQQQLSGLAVKLARIAKGMRQYELAAALRISPQRLSLIENGRVGVSERYLAYILQVLKDHGTRLISGSAEAAVTGR